MYCNQFHLLLLSTTVQKKIKSVEITKHAT